MAEGDLHLTGTVTVNVPTVEEIAAGITDQGDPLMRPVPGNYPAGTGGNQLGRLSGGPITVVSPQSRSGTLSLVSGDSYTGARALAFPSVSGDVWPADLTGWDLLFVVRGFREELPVLTAGVEVVDGVAPGQAVRVSLSAVETALLEPGGRYLFEVQATHLAERVTLRHGALEVAADAV